MHHHYSNKKTENEKSLSQKQPHLQYQSQEAHTKQNKRKTNEDELS